MEFTDCVDKILYKLTAKRFCGCMSAPPVQMAPPPPPPPPLPPPPPPAPAPVAGSVQSGAAAAEGTSGARLSGPEQVKKAKNALRVAQTDVATGLNIPK